MKVRGPPARIEEGQNKTPKLREAGVGRRLVTIKIRREGGEAEGESRRGRRRFGKRLI